jgi:hypothetical protein
MLSIFARYSVYALVALVGLAVVAEASVIVDETFADSERLTQSPPNSLQWTYGAHHTTSTSAFASLDASSGSLVWDHTGAGGNSFSAIWAHFTPSGAPLTLAIGETMTLSFDVTFSGGNFANSSGAFRWALFSSNGSRTTTDFAGTSEPGIASGTTFSAWRGYEGQLPVGGTTGDFLTRERTGSGNGLFATTNWAGLSGSSVEEPTFAASTIYPGWLALTRTATGVSVQASMNGVSTNLVTDTASPFTSFDTISFFVLDSLTHNITLDNIQVTVVPEPATVGLVAMMAMMGLLVLAIRLRNAYLFFAKPTRAQSSLPQFCGNIAGNAPQSSSRDCA